MSFERVAEVAKYGNALYALSHRYISEEETRAWLLDTEPSIESLVVYMCLAKLPKALFHPVDCDGALHMRHFLELKPHWLYVYCHVHCLPATMRTLLKNKTIETVMEDLEQPAKQAEWGDLYQRARGLVEMKGPYADEMLIYRIRPGMKLPKTISNIGKMRMSLLQDHPNWMWLNLRPQEGFTRVLTLKDKAPGYWALVKHKYVPCIRLALARYKLDANLYQDLAAAIGFEPPAPTTNKVAQALLTMTPDQAGYCLGLPILTREMTPALIQEHVDLLQKEGLDSYIKSVPEFGPMNSLRLADGRVVTVPSEPVPKGMAPTDVCRAVCIDAAKRKLSLPKRRPVAELLTRLETKKKMKAPQAAPSLGDLGQLLLLKMLLQGALRNDNDNLDN